jgi:hypothetical protein
VQIAVEAGLKVAWFRLEELGVLSAAIAPTIQ